MIWQLNFKSFLYRVVDNFRVFSCRSKVILIIANLCLINYKVKCFKVKSALLYKQLAIVATTELAKASK
jgi:hypothetical protein